MSVTVLRKGMRVQVASRIRCPEFPCHDVVHERFSVSAMDVDAASIRCALVCEAPAADPADDLHAPGESFFMRTTLRAFADAGLPASSMGDTLDHLIERSRQRMIAEDLRTALELIGHQPRV